MDKINTNAKGLDFGCGHGPALADILIKNKYSIDLYDPGVIIGFTSLLSGTEAFGKAVEMPDTSASKSFCTAIENSILAVVILATGAKVLSSSFIFSRPRLKDRDMTSGRG